MRASLARVAGGLLACLAWLVLAEVGGVGSQPPLTTWSVSLAGCRATVVGEITGLNLVIVQCAGSSPWEKDCSCSALCAANPACEFWVRITSNDDCILRNTATGETATADRRSGYRGKLPLYVNSHSRLPPPPPPRAFYFIARSPALPLSISVPLTYSLPLTTPMRARARVVSFNPPASSAGACPLHNIYDITRCARPQRHQL